MAKKRRSTIGMNPKKPTEFSDRETAERLVDLLNELLRIDHQAISCLINNRVPANTELANHPTVQTFMDANGFTVGPLGLLNGLCGVTPDGLGHIVAIYSDEDTPVLQRFTLNRE